MTITLEPATHAHLAPILRWLKEEEDAGQGGFYCNRRTIADLFANDEGICAMHEGQPIGFVVFQRYTKGSEIQIVEVHPIYRGQGIARQLMIAAEGRLRGLGAPCTDVECTSTSGEALCRRLGYEDYEDGLRNYRAPGANPRLRKYL